MKCLITGARGQLGSSLMALNDSDKRMIGLSREELDIKDFERVKKIIKSISPDAVINTAAYHNTAECEKNPKESFLVNCEAVKNLAEICKEKDIELVTISTDYVYGFNEKRDSPYLEIDAPGPVNIYGISKLAGEYASLYTWKKTFVIRSSGLYGLQGAQSTGGNFVDKRIKDAETIKRLEMSCEQVLTPTFTNDLAKAIVDLIQIPKRNYGLYHATNEGFCSWAEFTEEIYKLMDLETKVVYVDRGAIDRGMRKPRFSVLENAGLKKLGIEMANWKDSLKEYLSIKYSKNSSTKKL